MLSQVKRPCFSGWFRKMSRRLLTFSSTLPSLVLRSLDRQFSRAAGEGLAWAGCPPFWRWEEAWPLVWADVGVETCVIIGLSMVQSSSKILGDIRVSLVGDTALESHLWGFPGWLFSSSKTVVLPLPCPHGPTQTLFSSPCSCIDAALKRIAI